MSHKTPARGASGDSLAEAATKCGLSPAMEKLFRHICEEERAKPSVDLSKKESKAEVGALFTKAVELSSLLDKLSTKNLLWLNDELVMAGAPGRPTSRGFGHQVLFVEETLRLLAGAAVRVVDRHPDDAEIAKGGAPKAPRRAVGLVAVIARNLKDYGIAPTKSEGKFMSICRGCFELAFEEVDGKPLDPTVAVKAFLRDWRKTYKERGLCL